MPFRALEGQLLPDQLAMLGRAFDGVCEEVGLSNDGDAELRTRVARLILVLAERGLCDPMTLKDAAVRELQAERLTGS